MKRLRRTWFFVPAAIALGLTVLRASASPPPAPSAPTFGDDFWKRWGDGKGELSSYDLTFPRYGELRKGLAVTVFVTETFSNSLRVKADPGKHPPSDEFPVMKLNLVEDFSTGIYDYNLLTSTFVALAPVNGRAAGSVTKVSFNSQEWCGGVYSQLLFDSGSARWTSHSYFDGEADQSRPSPSPMTPCLETRCCFGPATSPARGSTPASGAASQSSDRSRRHAWLTARSRCSRRRSRARARRRTAGSPRATSRWNAAPSRSTADPRGRFPSRRHSLTASSSGKTRTAKKRRSSRARGSSTGRCTVRKINRPWRVWG